MDDVLWIMLTGDFMQIRILCVPWYKSHWLALSKC